MKKTILFSALVLSACGMTNAKIDKDVTDKAKKVAIVGFNLSVQQPKSLLGDLKKLKDGPEEALLQNETADEVYRDLANKLSKELNWDVKPRETVAANAAYKAIVKANTEGLQFGSYRSLDYKTLRPHGILHADPFNIDKVKRDQRDQLMNELGVDAIVVNFTTVSLKDKSWFAGMIGRAKYLTKAQNVIRVYVRGKDEPVWFDTWAWGEGSTALQANLNFVEDKPMLEQIVLASKNSISETMSRYKSN